MDKTLNNHSEKVEFTKSLKKGISSPVYRPMVSLI